MSNKITGSIESNGLQFVKATIDTIPFDKIRKNNVMATQDAGVATTSNAKVWVANGDISNYSPSVNSVDIDWNSAQVAGETLNTTGEMLSILQTAYNYATTYTGKTTLSNSTVLGKINGQPLKYGGSINIETGSDIDINHNHISISNYGNIIKAEDQDLTYFESGWYRIGYFGWNDANNLTGSHSLIFNIASDGYYRSSSICGSIIQSASENYRNPQAKINIINASKYNASSEPVFDGIRTVKELILPEIPGDSLPETYLTYGYPSQITYVDLHITENSKPLTYLGHNVSYMFSGHENFVYDNRLLKIPAFNSSFETIKSKDGSKTAYIGRTITYKPIEYPKNDITSYFYFVSENDNGIFDYNTSENPVRVGSSATINPVASGDIIYSVNEDENYIEINNPSGGNSVIVTPKESVNDYTSPILTTIYCTTASASIVKRIKVWVGKAINAINSIAIENTESIISAKDTGEYMATPSTSGSVGTLSSYWQITNGGAYASILGSNDQNSVTIQATNKTKVDQQVTLKCTVSSSKSGISQCTNSIDITIPAVTTYGYIAGGKVGSTDYYLPDTLDYGETAYITVRDLESTAYNNKGNDVEDSREWWVTNENAISFSDTNLENVTIENINNTGNNITCEIKCRIKFKSGVEHVASKEITANKQELKYYLYVGQTEPTSSNYTTLATQVTSYPESYTYTTTTRNYVYILIADNKVVSKIVDTNNFEINYSETTSPVSGYKVYKTAGIAAGGQIILTIS